MDVFRSLATIGAALAALALVVPLHGKALADEPEVASADLAAESGSDGATPADRQIEGTGGRVFLAAEVGEVSIDGAADIVGRKVFAERSQIAGSAATVSFSTRRPAPRLSGAFPGRLTAPLSHAAVTSEFGALRAQGGGGTRIHAGVDLAAPQGSPVAAAFDGRVSVANRVGSYGLLVVVDHPGGLQTRYAHLSRIAVSQGQSVRQGEVLGAVGSTGRSTGPHLHYELRQDGRPVDPMRSAR